MLRHYSPSNQHYLYSWRHSLILAMCGHWLEVPKDCWAFFGGARLNYFAILYSELFGNPPRYPSLESKRREEMRLPRRWAVAKTLKMCWPEWNTHFTSRIHSFEPISMICQHSGDDSSRVLHNVIFTEVYWPWIQLHVYCKKICKKTLHGRVEWRRGLPCQHDYRTDLPCTSVSPWPAWLNGRVEKEQPAADLEDDLRWRQSNEELAKDLTSVTLAQSDKMLRLLGLCKLDR